MDSEDSRPAVSSGSNSTSNCSSRASTPAQQWNEPKSPGAQSQASDVSDNEEMETVNRSRSRSTEGPRLPRSPRSESECSSSGSSSGGSATENPNNDVHEEEEEEDGKSKASSQHSSRAVSPVSGPQSPPQSPISAASRLQSPVSIASRPQTPLSPEPMRAMSRNSISHEDLSDVSDMESEKNESLNNSRHSMDDGENSKPDNDHDEATSASKERRFSLENNSEEGNVTDLRQRLDQKKKVSESNGHANGGTESFEELVKTHDEDALDFEAEEGECPELNKDEDKDKDKDANAADKKKQQDKKSDLEEGEELEEGEVSDEDEKRPEESEPKPVCRFYTRGQCTWGMSCRFLHPGVTDKGNYTMFDMMPPVSVPPGPARRDPYGMHGPDYRDYRSERPALHHRPILPHAAPPATSFAAHPTDARALLTDGPVVVESAWERGLRTAKEMMRKANKRKEQDMDFDEKKMNLTLSPDEIEKDPYYLKDRSPPDAVAPTYGRHPPMYNDAPSGMYSPPERYARGPPMPVYEDVDNYRSARYRELPPHRMPHYEDERRVRPTREVIVQRVEPPMTRGDEWNDPWMRSKSPLGRTGSRERNDKRRRDRRSYSSQSSYSSSSSSPSDSSSASSHSPSPPAHRRRYNSSSHKSPILVRGKHVTRGARSPSPQVRRPRRSPSPLPVSKRHHISQSPAFDRRAPISPMHKRKKISPVRKPSGIMTKSSKGKRRHTSSSSGTSDSSASDSDSSSSSSSGSSTHSRGRSPPKRGGRIPARRSPRDRKTARKSDPPKKRSPISIEIKRPNAVGTSALMSPSSLHNAHSSHNTHNNFDDDPKKTRREELLKQLRAVEDAIAKKRSKLS